MMELGFGLKPGRGRALLYPGLKSGVSDGCGVGWLVTGVKSSVTDKRVDVFSD